MKLFYRANVSLYRFFFKLFYHHKIYGAHRLPKGAAIIAPNHVSFWDPPMVGCSCPEELTFLAKKELFDNPILSLIIRHLNTYPISGSTHDINTIKLILHLLEEGKKIVIFPEGERTIDGQLTSIKPGIGMLAFRSQAPIIPVYISGNFEIWPINQKYPKLKGHTAIVFGSPIFINKFIELPKKEAQEAIAQTVHSAISELKKWFENGALGEVP